MTIELPKVTAYLHGGPRDGESIVLPWAMYDLHLPDWDKGVLDGVADLYRLRDPWRGQEAAHYRYVEPEQMEKAA